MFRIRRRDNRALQMADIDPARIPYLEPPQVIRLLSLDNRLRSIRRLAAISAEDFERYYSPAIHEFLKLAQLRPASAADHHAGLGGLVTHTLAVAESAMRSRKAALLPQNADPAQIAAEEHIWTYAVFIAGILHDAGKIITMTRLEDLQTGYYAIRYLQLPYYMQTRVNTTMFYLLPPEGREWIQGHPEILAQLVAYLAGDHYGWGVIGDLTQQADGESVARDRRTRGERQRLPHAPDTPLVERMMRVLRKLIYDGNLKINRNGGAGWVDGRYTYLVCGVAARKARSALEDEGSTDIPTDNTRLFDIWQDHGYIIANDLDKAIWNIEVEADDYCHQFSMLKFSTQQLFHPSKRPADFEGKIRKLEHDVLLKAEPPVETIETAGVETDVQTGAILPAEAVTDSDRVKQKTPQKTVKNSVMEDIPVPVSIDSDRVGEHFLSWVRKGLKDGRIGINKRDVPVHILPEGVALVSPVIFEAYLKHHDFVTEPGDLKKLQSRLQSRLEKLRLNIKNKRQLNVHTIAIENSSSCLYAFLFPHAVFYEESKTPKPNQLLTLKR